jgi:hypothetical protein
VTLRELLGAASDISTAQQALLAGFAERPDIEPVAGTISAAEEALAARRYAEEIGTDAFVAEIDDPSAQAGVPRGSYTGAARSGRN